MSHGSSTHEAAVPVFSALGSVTRLELLSRLGDGSEHSITALTDDLDLTRQAITKHLQVLQDAGIVAKRRVGRESRFAIRPQSIAQAKDYLARISNQWDEAIERLRIHVES